MHEAIINPNDRILDGSLGNWQGDPTLETGPINGKSDVMNFDVPGGSGDQIATLEYPHIIIPKGALISLYQRSMVAPFAIPSIVMTIEFTDGTETSGPLQSAGYAADDWQQTAVGYNIPATWDKTKSKIIITVRSNSLGNHHFYLDEFSAPYTLPTKIDYLPFLGIG
jgi:hypothetical protein